jgi:myosin-1
MDEECLRPGEPTDKSFLAKLNENLSSHQHYISHKKAGKDLQKSMTREVRSEIHFHCCVLFFWVIPWNLNFMC